MSEFGAGAARLAGIAGRLFGWTPETFWNATPAELSALIETGDDGADPPPSDAIAALRARFPDNEVE